MSWTNTGEDDLLEDRLTGFDILRLSAEDVVSKFLLLKKIPMLPYFARKTL